MSTNPGAPLNQRQMKIMTTVEDGNLKEDFTPHSPGNVAACVTFLTGETVTVDDFNALLAALKIAGLMIDERGPAPRPPIG